MTASKYEFIGDRDANGQPLEWFTGIPARDLEASDLAQLDSEQLATLESPNGKRLYRAVTSKPTAPAAKEE